MVLIKNKACIEEEKLEEFGTDEAGMDDFENENMEEVGTASAGSCEIVGDSSSNLPVTPRCARDPLDIGNSVVPITEKTITPYAGKPRGRPRIPKRDKIKRLSKTWKRRKAKERREQKQLLGLCKPRVKAKKKPQAETNVSVNNEGEISEGEDPEIIPPKIITTRGKNVNTYI